ncbi:SAM-dependent methyltransferase [Streptomyces sp. NPDC016562]|uniref:SAM-dependent methyltransferase n=1 Tax=Streptomyces sp. NPDC016562 TaxID=3364966 RepID=UPI0036FE121F
MRGDDVPPDRGREVPGPGPGPVTGAGLLAALCAARERSAESRRADRLFEDRIAHVATEMVGGPPRTPQGLGERVLAERSSAMGELVALRTRFFDDELLAASGQCRQVVLLGAGLDSRAFRLDWPQGTEVYEVDRGDVLRFKRGVVARAGQEPRCTRVEVAADLRGDWPGALRAAGFNPWRPTAWAAEGLLPLLSRTENDQLLSGITAMSAAAGRLVADHFDSALREALERTAMTEVLRAVGASWNSSLEAPQEWLAPHGWAFGLTDPRELARRGGRGISGVFGPRAQGAGHLWLLSAVR